ncbi:MAG: gluconate 2-dehydrogenase subunit 3 family protein [Acidobacteriota bacterium]
MKTGPSDLITRITRRQWLLRLGETVALAGVSGLIPESPLGFFSDEPPPLPPGLYEPSPDHLVRALSGQHAAAAPAGSETDYVQAGASRPLQFFSPEDFKTITSFISTLLGDVPADTLNEVARWVDLWCYSAQGVREAARNLDPMHRALAVAYFGEVSVAEIENADPASIVLQGLPDLNRICGDQHGKPFASLAISEQHDVVRSISTRKDASLQKLFELVRNEAIRGYYTSAAGLKELDYKGNTYYPYCPGCESAEKG